MRIGDAAAAAGTTPRALRFYEERGLLPPPARNSGGQRDYAPRDIERVRLIRELLASGLTVDDVRHCAAGLDELIGRLPRACAGAEGGPSAAPARPEGIAARRLAALDAEIDRLTRLRERLARQMNPEVVSRMEP
ncbi:MerR family transcriptional regulator [Streptomyces sp. NPDC007088]|uniref:MerR family transcriptional regulator n=1 Tax=Streptomyces sp. NPDC007088 TaxID=3364773 RepID=UPI003699C87C